MFEDKTFESIMNDMLTYVSNKDSKIDTSEGSLIYTAIAPMALELETAYREMDMILQETFLETASKEYLVKHGNQIGVELNDATFGHFEGKFDTDLAIGSRFNLDKFNYNVINKLSNPTYSDPYYTFELVCETAGSEPNAYLGDLTPITFVNNLTYAKLTSVLIYGEDEEETEAYRYRLQVHVKNPPINGNRNQYDEWLDAYDGIGKHKTLPCWNGVNTVKLLILNSENKVASDELISQVQDYFDPPTSTINDNTTAENYPQGRGMGNGQALIGSIVTVDTVTEVPVKIECQLVLNSGYSSPVGVVEAIEKYLDSIALDAYRLSYMSIAATIYNVESVKEISTLSITVKGITMDTRITPFEGDVSIQTDEIAVLDTDNCVWGV